MLKIEVNINFNKKIRIITNKHYLRGKYKLKFKNTISNKIRNENGKDRKK
jgi:hypothetical protein